MLWNMESSAGDSANNMDDDTTNQGNSNRYFEIRMLVIVLYTRKNKLTESINLLSFIDSLKIKD